MQNSFSRCANKHDALSGNGGRNIESNKMATQTETIDREAPAYKLVMKWGSNARFARAIGKTHSTTNRWLVNGWISGEYHADIMKAARECDIIVRPTDFVDLRLFNDRELECLKILPA